MILSKLSITGYKNIKEAKLELSRKINCFIGCNGAGKTNVLDAVYYLSFCRSASTSLDTQAISHGEDFFMLEGEYESDGGDTERIYCGMKRGGKKHFKRNGKEYKRLSLHIGTIPLVMASPADTLLIEGMGEERRKLMDMVISQYDRTYLDTLNAYNKALKQRNALLRQDSEPDAELMDILEEQMARTGEAVFSRRDDFIRRLEPVFQDIYRNISGGKEAVTLAYSSHCQRGDLLEVIRQGRERDRILGYSTHGIHRDELDMTLGGYPVKREGSQGQNKTFVISLKLAQFDFLRQAGNHATPLLMLDDIFDKLDSSRVGRIVRLVASERYGQIFITDTNRGHIDDILRESSLHYKLFGVDDGNVSEM